MIRYAGFAGVAAGLILAVVFRIGAGIALQGSQPDELSRPPELVLSMAGR